MSKLIGITGGIASGKTTVSSYIKKKGFPVICCDGLVYGLYLDGDFKKGLISIWKDKILTANMLDKSKLSKIVFADKAEMKKLNEYCFPFIMNEINKQIKRYKNAPYIFVDAPTLFESGLDKMLKFDEIWVVSVSKSTQVLRMKERTPSLATNDILNILKSQLSDKEKCKRGSYIIKNEDISIQKLYSNIDLKLDSVGINKYPLERYLPID